jgi:hypothetical protein
MTYAEAILSGALNSQRYSKANVLPDQNPCYGSRLRNRSPFWRNLRHSFKTAFRYELERHVGSIDEKNLEVPCTTLCRQSRNFPQLIFKGTQTWNLNANLSRY